MELSLEQIQSAFNSLPDARRSYLAGRYYYRVVILEAPVCRPTASMYPDAKTRVDLNEICFVIKRYPHIHWALSI